VLLAALVAVVSLAGASSAVRSSAGGTVVSAPTVRQGVFLSPDVVIGAGVVTATFSFDGIPAADYENPLNSMTAIVECSVDGVTGWQEAAGFTWHGTNGPFTDPKTGVVDPTNTVTFDVRRLVGLHCRANLTLPRAMTVGLSVTTQ
jgi:hypothetical protein